MPDQWLSSDVCIYLDGGTRFLQREFGKSSMYIAMTVLHIRTSFWRLAEEPDYISRNT